MDGIRNTVHTINGKGFHVRQIPFHLGSIAIIWLILRFTLFGSQVMNPDTQPFAFWFASITVAVCAHMAMMGKMFQEVAEVNQMIHILDGFTKEKEIPLTKDDISGKVLELVKTGKATTRNTSDVWLWVLSVDPNTKDRLLSIK